MSPLAISTNPGVEPRDDIRVVEHTGDPGPVADVLWELRPQYESAAALSETLRELATHEGLRIFGAHIDGDPVAAAAVTVRSVRSLSQGLFLYVDDLVTSGHLRGRGLAGVLLDRIDALAEESGCPGAVQLDSGVQGDRADAHRFYFGRGLRIWGYHFGPR